MSGSWHVARNMAMSGVLCVMLAGGMLACGGGDASGPSSGAGKVASVEVSQPAVTVGVGSTVALQVVVRDAAGRPITDRAVVWTSSDPTIATVSPSGVVLGIRTGTAQIAATIDGRSAVTTLTIAPRAVASVQVTPADPRLLVGASVKLSARTLDETGEALSGRRVVWSSSDARVASVDTTGLVVGIAPGVATITVSSENRSITIGVSVSLVPVARVDVNPLADTIVVGQTTQFTAVSRDSVGGLLADRMVSWGTSDVAVATVSSSGLVTGVSPGAITITAASAGRTADVMVVVRPRPVASVIVSPAQASLILGQTVQLTTQVTDDNGNLLSGRTVQFASRNSAIATVSAQGVVTGVGVGSTTIAVNSEGHSSEVNVQVTAVPVASLRMDPTSADLIVGGTARLSVVALDAAGNALSGRSVAWTSGAPAVATVSAEGVVTAVGPGTSVVLATVEGRTATATISVRAVPVGTVTVTPRTASVIVGDAIDLKAEARNAQGELLADRTVLWTSSDERIAVVSSTGRVRTLAIGSVDITASIDGVVASTSIVVVREPVTSVSVSPASLQLVQGGTATISATPRGRNGAVLADRAVTFTTSDAAVASVSASGLVTGGRVGTATVTATSEGTSATVAVQVSLAPVGTVTVTLGSSTLFVGASTQATVVLRDASGNALSGREISFSSSNALVASVSASGVVSALLPGTATITATSEGKTGSASVTVNVLPPAPVATVSVSLGASSLQVGGSTQATAVTRDGLGGVLSGRTVVWSSSNANVATVTASGAVSAVGAGTANIIATSEGKSGAASLTVTVPPPTPVATVNVTLGASSLVAGGSTQASAVTLDGSGNTLTGRTVAWTSSNTGVATVSASGAVTAVSAGTASITATSEGKSGSASLTVTAPPPTPVGSVTVSLGASSIVVGGSTTATAVTRSASGTTLTGRTVTWSSSNTAVATVSANGAVTGVSAGSATITATSEGVTGSASLTVTVPPPAPVATVSVSLASSTVAVGATTQASAVTRDANGAALTGRTVTWSSSNESVATVSATGVVTAVGSGSASITATSEGKSGAATVTVPQAAVARVDVTPSTATVESSGPQSGRRVQLTARAFDALNREITGRTVTWSSSNNARATVTSTGLVTGISGGSATITATIDGVSDTATITVRN